MGDVRTKAQLLADLAGGTHPANLALANLIETLFTPGDYTGSSAPAASAQASLTTSLSGSDNDLVWIAAAYGADGNDISIAYVDPSANSAELSVEVNGEDIVVNLATDSEGAISSTAAEVEAAVEAATSLVTGANSGGDDGSGVVTALSKSYLTGGTGTFPGLAAIGARYTDTTNGNVYINAGSLAAPSWVLILKPDADIEITGTLQRTKTTAVSADTTPTEIGFDGGLYLVSNTNDADDVIDLPTNTAADIGKTIRIYAVEGFEIQSADASATLNGVVIGATNECAVAAGTYLELMCVADNTWLALVSVVADGTPTQLVPDAV